MKYIFKPGLIILSLICLNCSKGNNDPPEDYWIKVRVDPTVELFCTIHRLAKTGVDNTQELPNYIRDIENYFTPFKNHRAVHMAKRLWETHHINLSALSTLVVYLGEPPELLPLRQLDPLPSELDSRWTVDVIPEFIEAAREFSRDSEYMKFFNSQKHLFDRSKMNLHKSLNDEYILDWFKIYFGYVPNNYTIIIGMQTGYGNYGASTTRNDGTNEFYSIIGAHSPFFWNGIPRFSSSWLTHNVVHEFCHPYINPLVAQNIEILKASGEKLYSYNKAKLNKVGCLAWDHMLNEYFVRACVIRYFHSKNDNEAIGNRIRSDENQGFIGIKALSDLLEVYEQNRDKYSDIESFIPQIVIWLEQYVASINEGT